MNASDPQPLGDSLPAGHPLPLDGPVTGPGVWYRSDLAGRDDWQYVLSESDRSELLDAMAHARAKRLTIVERPWGFGRLG